MLTALCNGKKVIAQDCERGADYFCTGCNAPLVLKKGNVVIHHFSHKSLQECEGSKGETQDHLQAKMVFHYYFNSIGYKPELEYRIDGKLRSDLFLEGKRPGTKVAYEFQHSPIPLDDLYHRTSLYAGYDIAVIWMPFIELHTDKFNNYIIAKYSPKQFERWIHGFHQGKVCYFDPTVNGVYIGQWSTAYIWKETYEGQKYRVKSKRFVELHLKGPYPLDKIKWSIKQRNSQFTGLFRFPKCKIVDFEGEDYLGEDSKG